MNRLFRKQGEMLAESDITSALEKLDIQGQPVEIRMSMMTARDMYAWDTKVTDWYFTDTPESIERDRQFGDITIIIDKDLAYGDFVVGKDSECLCCDSPFCTGSGATYRG